MKKLLLALIFASTTSISAHEDLATEIIILENKLEDSYGDVDTAYYNRVERFKYLKTRLDILELKLEDLINKIEADSEAKLIYLEQMKDYKAANKAKK